MFINIWGPRSGSIAGLGWGDGISLERPGVLG